MAIILNKLELFVPNNDDPKQALIIPGTHIDAFTKGGALFFRNQGGDITHVFSPVGYIRCTLSLDRQWYTVEPTFASLGQRPEN